MGVSIAMMGWLPSLVFLGVAVLGIAILVGGLLVALTFNRLPCLRSKSKRRTEHNSTSKRRTEHNSTSKRRAEHNSK